mmetsp:Transcript_121380/g.338175  ORF Transcript_121380/g.338175 Transcript_121380/m.338175 type:complete len:150 (-) Transcript_121380:835-1284(-)
MKRTMSTTGMRPQRKARLELADSRQSEMTSRSIRGKPPCRGREPCRLRTTSALHVTMKIELLRIPLHLGTAGRQRRTPARAPHLDHFFLSISSAARRKAETWGNTHVQSPFLFVALDAQSSVLFKLKLSSSAVMKSVALPEEMCFVRVF